MPRHALAIMLTALGMSSAALANGSPDQSELAKASGCFSCHAVTEKVVGPAFQSVAERYAGQSDAVAELAQSVTNGSTRKWGRAAMPPHGNMDKADIRKLVTWVLSQKK